MIKQKYPDAYDVSELVNFRTTPLTAIRSFAHRRGILVAGRGKEAYSSVLSRMLLDHQSYLDLRDYAQGGETKLSVSGFNLTDWTTPGKTVDDMYNDVMNLRKKLAARNKANRERKLPVIELSAPIITGNSLSMTLIYNRTTPGRIELLAQSEETVDFTISQVAEHRWQVLCLPRYNQDVESLQKLLKSMDRDVYQVTSLNLDDFPLELRIEFIDRIIEYYTITSESWKLREVTGMVVRRPDIDKNDNIFDVESDITLDEAISGEGTKVATTSDLHSINQAALEGHNLRTNSFVQDCERAGFYFPSVSMVIEHRTTPEVARVNLRFKLSPKIFEILLLEMSENTEIGERTVAFSAARQREILSSIWDIAHEIWHDINKGLPSRSDRLHQVSINV